MTTLQSGGMRKTYLMIFVLTFSNIVYLIPYLSLDFYNQFLEAYGLTDGQMGRLISCFGLTAVPGYLIGGWLADVFNPKKLVVLSCFLTAVVSVGVAFITNYNVLLVLYFLYGITSTMLNWSAYLKVCRMLGNDEEQGRIFGFTDVAYSIFSLLLNYGILTLTITLFADSPMGFRGAVLIYSGLAIISGIAIQILISTRDKSEYADAADGEDRIKLRYLVIAVKMPLTWYLSLFTLGYFIIRSTIPYINPYLTDAFGVSVAFATAFTATIRTGLLMIMSPFGGYIRDKLGGRATPIALAGSSGAIIGALVLSFIPQTASLGIVIMGVAIVTMIFTCGSSTCLYTPVAEGKVPIAMTGTVMGIASAIGYSSDIWIYTLCGNWLDKLGNAGYTNIWYLTVCGAVIMLITALCLSGCYKKARAIAGDEKSPVPMN